jgi:hypothetical protein
MNVAILMKPTKLDPLKRSHCHEKIGIFTRCHFGATRRFFGQGHYVHYIFKTDTAAAGFRMEPAGADSMQLWRIELFSI